MLKYPGSDPEILFYGADMIFDKWMSYITPEAPLNKLAMPGAHNACTAGMPKMSCCQNGTVREQLEYGVRHFCIRLDTDRKARIVCCHGISKGKPLAEALAGVKEFMDENPSEVLLLDIREYYDQKILGPIVFTYSADPKKVDEILAATVCPEKYAYTDFEKIGDVKLGDVLAAGKRFILINEKEEYAFSKKCDINLPWEKKVNGAKAYKFTRETLRFFNDYPSDGLYIFQTQQTPNLGTEIGLTSPWKLDLALREHFPYLIEGIRSDPYYLSSCNVVAGDFMTESYMKSSMILSLNVDKGYVPADRISEYSEGIKWN